MTDAAQAPLPLSAKTTRLEPFRRVNIPPEHLLKQPGNLGQSAVSGQGYDCGCRSTADYDGKVGKDIADQLTDLVEKVPFIAGVLAAKSGVAKLLNAIPVIGKKLGDLVDGFDPLRSLMEWLGKTIEAALVDSIMRSVPAWVPALRKADKAKDFLEQEVEGFAVRSRHRYDGVPYSQWHIWYDWSILVAPVGDFIGIVGEGNRNRTRNDGSLSGFALDSRRYELGWMPPAANIETTIECEWDLGALGPAPGPFLNAEAMKFDWGWPMAGSYVWASGRTVYDCTHATSDDKTGDNIGLHLNQLHPLKALATQRWEGFLFKENAKAVPAARFSFFASSAKKSAGDFQFPGITDCDYEFVVQLPPGGGDSSDTPFAVGATAAFMLNTIDVGRRLLVDIDQQPFNQSNVHHSHGDIQPLPKVQPLREHGTFGPITHAKITIPLSQISAALDYYGAIISLGWSDPAATLAKQVFKITVEFVELEIFNETEANARWQFFFAVNGRWFSRDLHWPNRLRGQTLRDTSASFFAHVDDGIAVAAHGFEQDGQGTEYELPEDDGDDPDVPPKDAPKSLWDKYVKIYLGHRTLRLSKEVEVPTGVSKQGQLQTTKVTLPFVGDPVEWEKDVDTTDVTRASNAVRALFLREATWAFDANDPIGLVDPNVFNPAQQLGRANDFQDTPNPLRVGDLLDRVGPGGSQQCFVTGYAMTQYGRMATLGYDEPPPEVTPDGKQFIHTARIDYRLAYNVKIEAQ